MTYTDFYNEWLSSCNYIVAHTSGSTGAPKEIHLLKSDMVASARATNDYFGIKQGDNLVCPLSLDYIAAKMMAVRAIVADANLVLQKPSNHLCISCNTALLAIVPSQVESLLEQPELCRDIKNIIIGGAPLANESRQRLISAGYNAYETYGMTETCSHVALKHIKDDYFKAIGSVTFSLDSRGCLVVSVPHMSMQSVVTNDVVQLIDDTTFKWLGRYDNVINTGGIKVHPEILESRISELIGSEIPFYIVGAPHPKWGQQVVMVVESSQKVADNIADILRGKLDHRIMPKKIFAVQKLERTPNGKLKRQIIG
jgi:O-succinylbenzoic acid--CoA ligase